MGKTEIVLVSHSVRCIVASNDSSDMADRSSSQDSSQFWWSLTVAVLLWAGVSFWRDGTGFQWGRLLDPTWEQTPAPLVMQGGDPYIRALMRTISASEANSSRPYSLLYGGEHIYDLSHHPDRCVTIVAGPNTGDCTTAAGRYQMLTTTWFSQASQYHPQGMLFFFWQNYSFEPKYQDEVVYRWLNDPGAWGADLSQLLRDGQFSQVMAILSPTWTSLGYGIETNDMTGLLPQIYQQVLQEELQASGMP